MLGLAFRDNLFWIVVLVYGLGIYLILKNPMPQKLKLILSIIIWVAFLSVIGLTIYVNYYLPHGPSYPTGEIVCQNDDRGPCREKYVEDLRNLNIPDWAKFFRKSEGQLLWMGLLFAGIVISAKGKNLEE